MIPWEGCGCVGVIVGSDPVPGTKPGTWIISLFAQCILVELGSSVSSCYVIGEETRAQSYKLVSGF